MEPIAAPRRIWGVRSIACEQRASALRTTAMRMRPCEFTIYELQFTIKTMPILYIVATPLGNLKDITLRALEVLKEADLIVCEDTRQTIKLLNHYNISKPLVSYFQHSKLAKIDYIAEQLAQGKNIALVTDAGTPGISDPGGKLIDQLINWTIGQLKITPIPGPNAAIAALSVSGFPADKFVFMGFPPHKKGRNKFFDEVANAKYTVVFYESTHRILKTLGQLKAALSPGRQIIVCRELTKQFESIYRGSAEEIIKILESDKNNQKGEFVIIVGGKKRAVSNFFVGRARLNSQSSILSMIFCNALWSRSYFSGRLGSSCSGIIRSVVFSVPPVLEGAIAAARSRPCVVYP